LSIEDVESADGCKQLDAFLVGLSDRGNPNPKLPPTLTIGNCRSLDPSFAWFLPKALSRNKVAYLKLSQLPQITSFGPPGPVSFPDPGIIQDIILHRLPALTLMDMQKVLAMDPSRHIELAHLPQIASSDALTQVLSGCTKATSVMFIGLSVRDFTLPMAVLEQRLQSFGIIDPVLASGEMLTIPFERYRSLKNLLGILSGSEVEQKYLPFDKDTKLQWIAAKSIGSRLVQDTKDEAKNKKAKGAKAIADREQEPEIFDSEFPEDTSGIPEFRKRFTREKKYSKKNLVDKSMVLLDLGLPLGTEMLPDDSAAVTPPWFPQDIATVLGAEGQDDDVVLDAILTNQCCWAKEVLSWLVKDSDEGVLFYCSVRHYVCVRRCFLSHFSFTQVLAEAETSPLLYKLDNKENDSIDFIWETRNEEDQDEAANLVRVLLTAKFEMRLHLVRAPRKISQSEESEYLKLEFGVDRLFDRPGKTPLTDGYTLTNEKRGGTLDNPEFSADIDYVHRPFGVVLRLGRFQILDGEVRWMFNKRAIIEFYAIKCMSFMCTKSEPEMKTQEGIKREGGEEYQNEDEDGQEDEERLTEQEDDDARAGKFERKKFSDFKVADGPNAYELTEKVYTHDKSFDALRTCVHRVADFVFTEREDQDPTRYAVMWSWEEYEKGNNGKLYRFAGVHIGSAARLVRATELLLTYVQSVGLWSLGNRITNPFWKDHFQRMMDSYFVPCTRWITASAPEQVELAVGATDQFFVVLAQDIERLKQLSGVALNGIRDAFERYDMEAIATEFGLMAGEMSENSSQWIDYLNLVQDIRQRIEEFVGNVNNNPELNDEYDVFSNQLAKSIVKVITTRIRVIAKVRQQMISAVKRNQTVLDADLFFQRLENALYLDTHKVGGKNPLPRGFSTLKDAVLHHLFEELDGVEKNIPKINARLEVLFELMKGESYEVFVENLEATEQRQTERNAELSERDALAESPKKRGRSSSPPYAEAAKAAARSPSVSPVVEAPSSSKQKRSPPKESLVKRLKFKEDDTVAGVINEEPIIPPLTHIAGNEAALDHRRAQAVVAGVTDVEAVLGITEPLPGNRDVVMVPPTKKKEGPKLTSMLEREGIVKGRGKASDPFVIDSQVYG
jgi:hypothetical protein